MYDNEIIDVLKALGAEIAMPNGKLHGKVSGFGSVELFRCTASDTPETIAAKLADARKALAERNRETRDAIRAERKFS